MTDCGPDVAVGVSVRLNFRRWSGERQDLLVVRGHTRECELINRVSLTGPWSCKKRAYIGPGYHLGVIVPSLATVYVNLKEKLCELALGGK